MFEEEEFQESIGAVDTIEGDTVARAEEEIVEDVPADDNTANEEDVDMEPLNCNSEAADLNNSIDSIDFEDYACDEMGRKVLPSRADVVAEPCHLESHHIGLESHHHPLWPQPQDNSHHVHHQVLLQER